MVPLTSNVAKVYPFQVLLAPTDIGLPVDSKAQAEQVRIVAVEHLSRWIGRVVPGRNTGRLGQRGGAGRYRRRRGWLRRKRLCCMGQTQPRCPQPSAQRCIGATMLSMENQSMGRSHRPPSQGLMLAGLTVGSSTDSLDTFANPSDVKF